MDTDLNPVDEILLPRARVAERAMGKFRPKMRFKTEVSIPTTHFEPPIHVPDLNCLEEKSDIVPFCIDNLNVIQGSVNQLENSHSEVVVSTGDDKVTLQCDQGEPGEVGDLYNMEALDFTQPPLSKVMTVGRFQPKTKAQTKGKMLPAMSNVGTASYGCSGFAPVGISSEAILHDGVSRDQTQVYGSHTSSPIGFDKLESEATTVLSGLESFDDGLFQSSSTAVSDRDEVIHGKSGEKDTLKLSGFEQLKNIISHPSSITATWDSTDLVKEQEDQVETCTLDVSSLECVDLPLGRDNCIDGYTKSSIASKDISGEAQSLDVESTPHILYGSSIHVPVNNDTCKSSRKLRKRTDLCSPVANDKINDVFEFAKSINETYEECSHEEYTVEERPKRKRKPRKCKSHETETEKSVRKHKKALDQPSMTNQESIKKKFPHRTRRKRQVNKVLLETPEEEIDRRKISLKDLIMLGGAKERISNKAAAVKKSNLHESAENHFDDEDRNFYGDEADPKFEESSTRLNYHSFLCKPPTMKWLGPEIELFYKGLSLFGTNFDMIRKLFFPKASHRQLKAKYKSEDKKHPLQVDYALAPRSSGYSHFKLLIKKLREESE